ncbi:MAG: hypothetical protein ACPGNT_09845 [Rhodospirillales bacterium]
MADRNTLTLPYRARTATGDVFDIDFFLHPETGSAVDVENLLTALLACIDREVGLKAGKVSNGDVLQAVAMALAVRSAMIAAPERLTQSLSRDLLERALHALSTAGKSGPPAGHA